MEDKNAPDSKEDKASDTKASAAGKPAAAAAGSAKNQKEAKPAAKLPFQGAAMAKPNGKVIKVKSFVNMSCNDGSQLVVGQVCELGIGEHERLQKDARGPFYEMA